MGGGRKQAWGMGPGAQGGAWGLGPGAWGQGAQGWRVPRGLEPGCQGPGGPEGQGGHRARGAWSLGAWSLGAWSLGPGGPEGQGSLEPGARGPRALKMHV